MLIVKNDPHEGPGTIEDYLIRTEMKYRVVEFSRNDHQLTDLGEYSHLVLLGGPMAVYETDQYPYLRAEAELIRVFINSGRAVLGICLGAQMIAHALGGNVYPGATQEIGWGKVDITPEGMEDSVLSTIAVNREPFAEVFQWHGDTFDLPRGAVRVSSSPVYQNQAFKYEDRVYALQFHIEITPGMIKGWFQGKEDIDIDAMLDQTDSIYPEYAERAMNFYKHFFSK